MNRPTARRTEAGPMLRLALDLGPLLVYFAAYSLTHKNIFASTGIFMAATGGGDGLLAGPLSGGFRRCNGFRARWCWCSAD